jgi:hypothetical protein
MKSLEEKKLLARMARNIGQPDFALEESIRHEENLFKKLFKTEENPIDLPVLVEEKLFTPSANLVHSSAEHIKLSPTERVSMNESPDPISKELTRLRTQLADVMQRIGTMSWGAGGTGVVRFDALDDHQHPADIRVLEFNTAGPAYPPPVGSLAWNPDEDCVDVYQEDGSRLQVGLEQYIQVCNHTGATLSNGTFVMFGGVHEPNGHGNIHLPEAVPFTANGAYPPLYTIGVLTNDIVHEGVGRATTFGRVRQLNTTGSSVGETWVVGDLLWAHPTIPGALTKVKPAAPDIALSVAAVLHIGTTDGILLVRPTIFPQLHTGTFASNVQQTAAQSNTAYAVTWNTDGLKCPHINVANTTQIVVQDSGLYQYEFRLHLEAPKNQSGRIWLWVRVNGVDVAGSATEVSLIGSGQVEARQYPSWSFVQHMNAGSYLELMWATNNTQLKIHQPEAVAFAPIAYSAVIRVIQVNL